MSALAAEDFLLSYFKKTDPIVIFDIGSCNGNEAVEYGALFPHAQIHSFEPIPANVSLIRENIVKKGVANVQVNEMAMSDTEGTAVFQVSSPGTTADGAKISQSSSLLAPDKHLELYPWCTFDTNLTVKTDTLDHFCSVNRIPHIDYIHMDVQGAELMVLKGAQEKLQHIHSIFLEVGNVTLYKNQPLRKDIERFMKRNGFILAEYRIGGYSGDQLYINANFISDRKGRPTLLRLRFKGYFLGHPVVIFASRLMRKFRFLVRS